MKQEKETYMAIVGVYLSNGQAYNHYTGVGNTKEEATAEAFSDARHWAADIGEHKLVSVDLWNPCASDDRERWGI